MIFKSTGIGSRSWYIQQFKENPDSSGTNFLTEAQGISFYTAKEAVTELINAGYLKDEALPGKRQRVRVTSFGHRYLEEHKNGSAEPVKHDTALQVGQGEKHSVMQSPEPKRIFSNDPASDAKKWVPQPEPVRVAGPIKPVAVVPEQQEAVATPIDSFADQFKIILAEIMVPRFAKEVTAADILEHLDNSSR